MDNIEKIELVGLLSKVVISNIGRVHALKDGMIIMAIEQSDGSTSPRDSINATEYKIVFQLTTGEKRSDDITYRPIRINKLSKDISQYVFEKVD